MSPLSATGRALITTFGLGFMRPISGTWGSLPPLLAAFALLLIGQTSNWPWYAVMAGFVLIFSAACVLWGDAAEHAFGKKDPGQVVADETAGMAVVLLFVPRINMDRPLHAALLLLSAFVIWRLADIIKPWPANGLQRIRGGWGILIDDLVAALYAGIAVLILGRLIN